MARPNPNPTSPATSAIGPEAAEARAQLRRKLERAGSFHGLHWGVVALSLALTFTAWQFSKRQVEEKVERRFERESQQVIELVLERMDKYGDALWAGVSFVRAHPGEVDSEGWREYSDNLRLVERYPGINGIGVVHSVQPPELPSFLDRQRERRPDFEVHPSHEQDILYPITFIEPAETNKQAVGLDLAHERNRFSGVNRARDTGQTQITGPIVLVQDAAKTPGFLFYAPFYGIDAPTSVEERRDSFQGLVYAPFVMNKLMEGTLAAANRHVGIAIQDGEDVLYDEHSAEHADFDPEPLFKSAVDVSVHGRTWTFDVWSAASFRAAQGSSQPLTILVGGILIDGMLIGLFWMISRANRQALSYADEATADLEKKAEDLERSNTELERFAFIASHDLQEPLRMVGSFAQLIESEYEPLLDEQGKTWLGFMVDGAQRMQQLVRDLLAYSQADPASRECVPVDLDSVVRTALTDLGRASEEVGARITTEPLPRVLGDEGQLALVLQNLISNAIKFRRPDVAPVVAITSRVEDETCQITVEDNGIGIEAEYLDRIFVIFQRLHSKEAYPGTGLGLAICNKIIEGLGGEFHVDSTPGEGSRFTFTLPLAASVEDVPSPVARRDKSAQVRA